VITAIGAATPCVYHVHDAAAEAPGGAGVPNRVLSSERRDPGPFMTRPPKRLEAPACRVDDHA